MRRVFEGDVARPGARKAEQAPGLPRLVSKPVASIIGPSYRGDASSHDRLGGYGKGIAMPTAAVRDIAMHYETEGSGDPLILIPYLSADHACYTFQTPEYSKHFSCVSVDLRGAGTTDKPTGPYSTEQLADDVAGLMGVLDVDRAHVAGVSLGAAVGMWVAAK